jgi:predicted HD superfamily hydrolase involved in NAD metabolism
VTGTAFVRLARRVRENFAQRKRFVHTLGVARMAMQLARRHGEDPGRALCAGMLHDLARLYSGTQLREECAQRGLPIDAFEEANPVVLHARVGAELARERFECADEGVLSAIRKHTLGDPSMSRLDTIVYLADALEPGRKFPERAAFAALAREDLDRATMAVVGSSISYLAARGLTPAPRTLALAAALERRLTERETHTAGIA